jgi:hypothetical protein
MSDFQLSSPFFAPGAAIPDRCSRQGGNTPPPLEIDDVPKGATSLALIMDDPDAPGGTFVHWLVWNIPTSTGRLDRDQDGLPKGAIEGVNSWGQPGYGGPQPPSGTHRYYFRLYALDTTLDLLPASPREKLEGAMQGHIVAQAELMGTYAA